MQMDIGESLNNDLVDEDYGDASNLLDSVCAICDNGGEILCCEGTCMRSFHAINDTGFDSQCRTLGYSRAQVEEMKNFYCANCKYKKHQCFACGRLGSSDKLVHAEVFRCVSAKCGVFYHPKCVSQLLFQEDELEAKKCEKKVAAGESFTCPVHKCFLCKQGENKGVKELQFALCRRCPKSYHRKCLPKKIRFENLEERGILQRAWDDLLPDRILIYCLDHEMDEHLGTPLRNHIVFPEIPSKGKLKIKLVMKKRPISDDLHEERHSLKPKRMIQSHAGFEKVYRPEMKQIDSMVKVEPSKQTAPSLKEKGKVSVPSLSSNLKLKKFRNSFPVIDNETMRRMKALLDSTSSPTIADIIKKRIVPSTHTYIARFVEKTITNARVEVTIEAVRTALLKLESSGSIEDAKAVCEPDILKEILKWRKQLNVYLSPFLHGMRYTSFGRHFTKVDKLKEIVDKLEWYVQNGDTIVDFCCGANDFSKLMKEKLDEVGKACSFKNYDIIQPKNDFCFERRDWMEVLPTELPNGSQLIMGLNPPFGVKASLANKFINKALAFRPKLVILIVPKETERLDEKNPPYDLIWEDCEKLAGKSFYLPGSIDSEDQQMEQWNTRPPPLYLWSRSDWTKKHKSIAVKCGHIGLSEDSNSSWKRSKTNRNVYASTTNWQQSMEGSEYGRRKYRNAPFPEYPPGPDGAPIQDDLSQWNGHDAFGSRAGPFPSSSYGIPSPAAAPSLLHWRAPHYPGAGYGVLSPGVPLPDVGVYWSASGACDIPPPPLSLPPPLPPPPPPSDPSFSHQRSSGWLIG